MRPPDPADIRRLVLCGTPGVAVHTLRTLDTLAAGGGPRLVGVVTRPDTRRGRGGRTAPSPVKAAAVELGVPVHHTLDVLDELEPDLVVVVAYGRLIPAPLLERHPMVNIHFSLLPRWRGAAPVERAILAGDTRTGVCLMEVVEELDAGGVYARAEVTIGPDETADELRGRLSALGDDLLVEALRSGFPDPRPQTGAITYAHKIDPSELELDWRRPALELHRVVRVGGAWTTFRGRRLKVWRTRVVDAPPGPPGRLDGVVVATGDGGLELIEVQPEGRRRVDAASWRNGARPRPDEVLGS